MTQMDKNETPINIDLALSKAFDTLDHNILIQKLEYYGITENNLDIYINDMSTVCELFAFIIYADDTTLFSISSAFKSRTDKENIETKRNKELSKYIHG